MLAFSPNNLAPLPTPPNYMRAEEQRQVRTMTGPMGRPAGNHRCAERIMEQSPVMKQFLERPDHYVISDDLKRQVGDWTEDNQDPEARADAAYDLEKVLRFIDNADDRILNQSESRNGQIDGITDYGYRTADNSEASILKAYSSEGYRVLRNLPS